MNTTQSAATNLVGQTVTIGRRVFTVTEQSDAKHGPIFIMKGVRGATYGTVRNVNRPWMMFLVHAGTGRGFGIPAGYEGVWLTDRNGSLEVL